LIAIDPARLTPAAPRRGAGAFHRTVPHLPHSLGLDSVEDYDLLVLRLLSGEGGFVSVRPDEVAARSRAELLGANPDPALLREFGGARSLSLPTG